MAIRIKQYLLAWNNFLDSVQYHLEFHICPENIVAVTIGGDWPILIAIKISWHFLLGILWGLEYLMWSHTPLAVSLEHIFRIELWGIHGMGSVASSDACGSWKLLLIGFVHSCKVHYSSDWASKQILMTGTRPTPSLAKQELRRKPHKVQRLTCKTYWLLRE